MRVQLDSFSSLCIYRDIEKNLHLWQVELLRVQLATVPGAPPVSLLAQTVRLLQHLPSSAMTARLA